MIRKIEVFGQGKKIGTLALTNTYGDFNGWVDIQIESTIDTLKN